MIINKSSLTSLFIGFSAIFKNALKGEEPKYERITTVTRIKSMKVDYPWMGMVTKFRKWISARVLQNLKVYKWTIENEPYENTISVKREDIEFDNYGVYDPVVASIGENTRKHPDALVFPLLAQGATNKCFDGQFFFDTDHPVGDTTVSNYQGGSGALWVLMATKGVMKPMLMNIARDYDFVALDDPTDQNVFMSREYVYGVDAIVNAGYGLWQLVYASRQPPTAENVKAAIAAMKSLKLENGDPMDITPDLIVCAPSIEHDLKQVVAATLPTGGANTLSNAAEIMATGYFS